MSKTILFFLLTCLLDLPTFAGDTVLKFYRPFGEATEQASPSIKKTIEGTCSGQSKLSVREDAWRCQAGDTTFDPCFARMGTAQKKVLCPASPWSGKSVLIQVSSPLNNAQHLPLDMSRSYPWAIELRDGNHCLAVDNTEIYDAMPIRYHCAGHTVLLGYLQRCNPQWTMLAKTGRTIVTVEISKAWF
jgi:hypothetical protein